MDITIEFNQRDMRDMSILVEETRSMTKAFKKLGLNKGAESTPSQCTENLSEESAYYLFALRSMFNLFNKGRSLRQIQNSFASRGKFFPVDFIGLVLGGEGGLTRNIGFYSSTRALELDARTCALALILQGQENDLDHEDVLQQLDELGFDCSESFFWHFRFSRERFFTTLASEGYLWKGF